MRLVMIAAVAALAGCARTADVQLGDGSTAKLISCRGSSTASAMGDCYSAAAASCPAGYDVVDVQMAPRTAVVPLNNMLIPVQQVDGTLMIRCR